MARDIAEQFDALTDEELWIAVYRDLRVELFWTLAARYRGDIVFYAIKMAARSSSSEDPESVAEEFYRWCLADELARKWRSFDPERGYRLKTYTKTIVPSLWAAYYERELSWAANFFVRGARVDGYGIPVMPKTGTFAVSADTIVDVYRRILAARELVNQLKGREAYILQSLWMPVWREYGERAAKYLRERLGLDPAREARTMLRLARTGGELAVRNRLCKKLGMTKGALFTATHRAKAAWTALCVAHGQLPEN
ncbi:MAG: hypothetical protein IT350_05305 [Deltaproteobacteria bacterium]|nr:hypothetical protein [Deltaproteobacteria bacterium]